MGRPVRTNGDTGMGSGYFYGNIVYGNVGPYLFVIPARAECGIGRYKRYLAIVGHARGDKSQVLLGYSNFDKTFGEFLGKPKRPGGLGQVGAKHNDPLVLL